MNRTTTAQTRPHILLNDAVLEVEFDDTATLEAALEAISKEHLPEGEVLSEVILDGEICEFTRPGELPERSLGESETLELKSQTPDDAARQGIEQLPLVVESSKESLSRSAQMFRLGRREQGAVEFVQGAGLLQDVLRFVPLYCNFRGLDPEDPDWKEFGDIDKTLMVHLGEFQAAEERGDWNLIADLIEYEFIPIADKLLELGARLGART